MSSAWRRRSGVTSRIDTSAPRPTAVRAALRPPGPAPRITTLPGGTPGTPERRIPRPPGGRPRENAPPCTARRPATSLLGARSGRRPAAAALDDDRVAGFGEGAGAGGRQRDARFARLDLARDPDDHRAPKAATEPRVGRLSRSACAGPSARSISPHV